MRKGVKRSASQRDGAPSSSQQHRHKRVKVSRPEAEPEHSAGRPDGPVELRPRSLFQGSRLHSDDVSGERGVRSDGSGGGRSRHRRGGFASPRSSLGVFCSADP
ncbi:hypothetical protein NL676_004009 [Syzygium grande]|nr:hypothetical protein NL676_004009 [Syzygium grande]